jgi:hypothetical protein
MDNRKAKCCYGNEDCPICPKEITFGGAGVARILGMEEKIIKYEPIKELSGVTWDLEQIMKLAWELGVQINEMTINVPLKKKEKGVLYKSTYGDVKVNIIKNDA